MKKLILILIACNPEPDPCPAPFDTLVTRTEIVDGVDLKKRIYTQWAIYGLSEKGDTLTRQPTGPCYHEEIYGFEHD